MTHFLARLVGRTRGEVPRVEPIVAPRFAPAPVAEIAREPETVVTKALPEPVAAAPTPRPVRPAQETKMNGKEIVRHETQGEAAPDDVKLVEPEVEVLSEKLLVPPVLSVATDSLLVRQGEVAAPTIPLRKDGRTAQTPRERSKIVSPVSPIPATAARFRDDVPHEPAMERPIVRVTIGRIEVRAAPAPAAPTKRAAPPAAPKLTLDAYLQSRKEGGR